MKVRTDLSVRVSRLLATERERLTSLGELEENAQLIVVLDRDFEEQIRRRLTEAYADRQ